MTQFRFSEEDQNALDKELEEINLRKMEEQAKRNKERDEWIRTFESLSYRIGGGNNNDGPDPNNNGNGNNGNGRRRRDEVLDSYYRELMARFTFKTLGDSQEILWYDPASGVYQFNGEVKIKSELQKIFDEELAQGQITIANLLTEHDRKEIVSRIKWTTITQRELFDDNRHGNMINVQNGLLDTRTKELKPHSPEFLCTKQFPIKYNHDAKWTYVLRFLKQIQNKEGVNTLLKMFGYILMTDTNKYQKAFFFAGLGNNGKSVLTDLINAFVGPENFSSVQLHELKNDRFMKAQFYGKIVNTYADVPATPLSDVGLFKALVSGDEITAQHKYGQPFKFRNRSKMIYSGNAIPLSEGEDELAYFKRWVMLKFDALFTSETEDRDLLAKLTTPENLSGLLNLALVGIPLLERDGFENVPIEVIRAEYNRESESAKSFVEKDCAINIAKREYYMIAEDLYDSYLRHWKGLKDSGVDCAEPLSDGKLEIELAKSKVFKGRKQVGGVKRTVYKGIITLEEANKRNQEILERQKQSTF